MENAGREALIIGVNVLIFVVALSVAIMLMVNVINMSDIVNDIIKSNNKGSLVETKDIDYIKVISGEQLLKYNVKNIGNIIVKDSGSDYIITNYISSKSISDIINSTYLITMNSSREFVFVKQ